MLLGAVLLPLVGCANRWPSVRKDTIDPIQELLHRSYPKAIAAHDLTRVRDLYVSTQAAPDLVALLGRFRKIDGARAVIDDARWDQAAMHAKVSLIVEGVLSTGEPLYVSQKRDMTVTRIAGEWRIEADTGGPLTEVRAPGPFFTDETARRGISFRHIERWHPDAQGVPRRHIYASGPGVGDVDGDGWDDAVLVNGDRVVLYLNERGKFRDVTEAWGLKGPIQGSHTATLLADFDGDGRLDLFSPAEYAQPLFFRNTGSRFEPWANSGIVTAERTTAACAADFDGDGDLDLYLGNNEDPHRVAPDPQGFARNAQPDQLFLNNGDGTFRDASDEAGVGNTGWTLGCTAADYDGDGDVDVYVGNDFGADALYRNDGKAHFTEVSRLAGADAPVASMSTEWGDYDGDGYPDLFVAGMSSSSDWIIDHPDFPLPGPAIVRWLFPTQVRAAVRGYFHGNRLFHNQGDGTFREVSLAAGVENSSWAWGSTWFDFDNDGQLDVYSANGMISGPEKKDL